MSCIARSGLIVLLVAVLVLVSAGLVEAGRGAPGSPEFGFGAVIYPDGPYLREALARAGELELDWVHVPLNWAAVQPDPAAAPRLDTLDAVMQLAAQRKISTLVSITNPPAWALTSAGPNPAQVSQLVTLLEKRYPGVMNAVELFPGANTHKGWGALPDPAGYAALLQTVSSALSKAHPPVLLVAGGLRPLAVPPPPGDLDDLAFLQGLYQQGLASQAQVISLSYGDLTGSPLALATNNEQRVLRRYEDIRRVMVANGHTSGRIWITRSSVPSGTINPQDAPYQEANAQAAWVSQAYVQLRSQLYLGAGFLQSLNPEFEGAASAMPSLIRGEGSHHPLFSILNDLIQMNRTGSVVMKPGKAKDGSLGKKRP